MSILDRSSNRLDTAISDMAYILDTLVAYRRITKTGSCNDCAVKECEYAPDPGETVRYNCLFYQAEGSKE